MKKSSNTLTVDKKSAEGRKPNTEAPFSSDLAKGQKTNPLGRQGSQVYCLLRFFLQRPGQWIPVEELTKVLRSFTVATKVTTLRRLGYVIENKQEQRNENGVRRVTSFYRFVAEGGSNV